jgi:C-terminal processing protease CtpA/Prc
VRAADPRARGLALAKTLAGKRAVPKPRKVRDLPLMKLRNDLDYPGTVVPSRAHRVLAGVRAWAALEYFFPYRYLIADWDRAFRDALPKLEAAGDRDAYLDALRELGARAGDGHIAVWSVAKSTKKEGIPPFETRMIEKQLVITRIVKPVPGVAVGDIVETVDGKPVAEVMASRRSTISGSTDEARDQHVATLALGGADGTAAKLRVRTVGGKPRDVTLTREAANWMALSAPAQVPHWKKLANQIGYVDLRLLTVPEVPTMFTELKDTRAIVFDMRGYPKSTAWTIAPRVNTRRAKHGAQFLKPFVTGWSRDSDQRIRFLQPLPSLPANTPLYTGKIVVLIDDRAISQSEHTCLFLQEAAGATFIGSPTAGANGDITMVRLPGELRMVFTGQEVRHLDGKQLQKVGITPHVVVRPTIAGIRAGKDEVLERALAWLAAKK